MVSGSEQSPLEIGALITGMGGGLALFLYGMREMTEALKTVAGSGMKGLLARLTANRFTAALAGTIITGIIQSSSVTTVLVVGFISAGLMNLSQSIGVIIGANIGTTVTAQVIAFKIYKYGLLMIGVGFLLEAVSRNEKVRHWGTALMGLGLVFFGMELMSGATGPLRSWPPFIHVMQNMQSPLLGILIGAVFTAIIQSSSATTGLVIVLASQGLITLESGIGLIFGANIGTCFTAFLSAIGRPREARQAAWVHIVFNVGGVVLWMFLIPQFADLVRMVSPASSESGLVDRLAAETPRQIANAHTIFNVINAILFIGFTGPLARLVERLVPEKESHPTIKAEFLDDLYLESPAMALDQVRRELARLASLVGKMMSNCFGVVIRGTDHEIERMIRSDDDVDGLHGEIITFLGRLSQKNLVNPQPRQLYDYIGIANYLENIGDVIENDLMEDARKRRRLGVAISETTREVLATLHQKILESYGRIQQSLETGDMEAAQQAAASKAEVFGVADRAASHLTNRLIATEPNRLAAFQTETEIIENLKRLNTLTRRIARLILEIGKNGGDLATEQSKGTEESERDEPGGKSETSGNRSAD